MSWQQQLQQAAQRPTDEGRQRRCQSETVMQQQHRNVTERRETTLATSGMGASRLGTRGPVASVGGEYLYPPEWQQRGRTQQLPHSPTWRHQLQQQQIWQQQQLQQQRQGPPTQQGMAYPAAPALTIPAHSQQRQQGGSGYVNNGSRPYSHVGVSSAGHGWEADEVDSRSGLASSRIGYCGTAAAVTYGSDSSSIRNTQHENTYWGRQQQLLLEQEQQRSAVQEVEEQCMQSLQSSLRVAAETNEISQSTAVKLEEQSEQLRGIRDTTVEIQENLQTSDYLLKGMKSWWGAFAQLFTAPPAAAKTEDSATLAGDNKQRQQQQHSAAAPSSRSRSKSGSSRVAETVGRGAAGADFSRSSRGGVGEHQQQLVVGDASSSSRVGAVSSDFDMRLEQDLQKLSEMLGEMHERAVAINSNLKQQNGMLGEIEKNVDANQSSIAQQKKMLKEIMRK